MVAGEERSTCWSRLVTDNQGLEHLPRMMDLAKTEENRKVLEIFAAPAFIGRSFVTTA